MVRIKHGAVLDARRGRGVQCAVTGEEKAALASRLPKRGQLSELMRDVVCHLLHEDLAHNGDLSAWISARMEPYEIDAVAEAGRAVGLEPTVLLRLLVTARAHVGTGETLWRLLNLARNKAVTQSMRTPERQASARKVRP